MQAHQAHWGIPQWTAYLRDKDIPIMPRTKTMVEALNWESVAPKELANIVMCDPFLGLRLLRRAEQRRSTRLGKDTTTILGAVQQVGCDGIVDAVATSPLCDEQNEGLASCEARSVLSASIACTWASHRADVSPQEIALASLLGEIGELMLWAFAPELPQRTLTELQSGRVKRNVEAQQQVLGFSFKQLSISLIEAWNLPLLIMQLVRGADTPRANIARISSDTARHVQANPRNPAIPDDIMAVREYLPAVSWQVLLESLPISEDYREAVYGIITGNGGDLPEEY